MVTVSSAFISSRRERIIFSVLSASGCAFKAAAWVDVLRVFGKTDLDNTDVARDHSFHCTANAESRRMLTILHYGCGVNGFNIPVKFVLVIFPSICRPGSAALSMTGSISCRCERPRPARAGPPAG